MDEGRLPPVFGFFKKRRRRKIREGTFPEEWIAILETNLGVYRLLAPEDQRELQEHVMVFLAEKRFEGCGGLEIDDEIRVTIAGQACLLLLHREPAYYPSLKTILVYPALISQKIRTTRTRNRTAWESRGSTARSCSRGTPAGAAAKTPSTATTSCCTSLPINWTRWTVLPTVLPR